MISKSIRARNPIRNRPLDSNQPDVPGSEFHSSDKSPHEDSHPGAYEDENEDKHGYTGGEIDVRKNKRSETYLFYKNLPERSERKRSVPLGPETRTSKYYPRSLYWLITALAFVLVVFAFLGHHTDKNSQFNVMNEITLLREKYINQDRTLWQNVLKIVNTTEPMVHALILLHNSSNVAQCVAKDIMGLINQKMMRKKNDISFFVAKTDTDHGEDLEHYWRVVVETRHLLVFEVGKLKFESVRIFHYLCDPYGQTPKPSYFIFTLEDNIGHKNESRQTENVIHLATRILKNSWIDEDVNILLPLLSRIVRNVVRISEESIKC